METVAFTPKVINEVSEYFNGQFSALIEEALLTDYEVMPLKVESSVENFGEALEMYYSPFFSTYEQRANLRSVIKFTSEKDLIPIMVLLLNSEDKDETILAIRKMAEILSEN